MRVFTGPLTSPLTITRSMGIQQISFKVVGNGGTVYGDFPLPTIPAINPSPITLVDGDSFFANSCAGSFIEGLTLTPGGATFELQVFFN